jgi:hypothetical protein
MELDDATVEEFRVIFQEEYGRTVSVDEAREMAQRVLTLYDLLLRPLPSQRKARREGGDAASSSPPTS